MWQLHFVKVRGMDRRITTTAAAWNGVGEIKEQRDKRSTRTLYSVTFKSILGGETVRSTRDLITGKLVRQTKLQYNGKGRSRGAN